MSSSFCAISSHSTRIIRFQLLAHNNSLFLSHTFSLNKYSSLSCIICDRQLLPQLALLSFHRKFTSRQRKLVEIQKTDAFSILDFSHLSNVQREITSINSSRYCRSCRRPCSQTLRDPPSPLIFSPAYRCRTEDVRWKVFSSRSRCCWSRWYFSALSGFHNDWRSSS